jgi:hypothetical protein
MSLEFGAPHRRHAVLEWSGDGSSWIIVCTVCMLIPNSSTAYFAGLGFCRVKRRLQMHQWR